MSGPVHPRRVLVPLGLSICLSLFGDLTLFSVLVDQLDVVGLSLAAAGVMLAVHRLLRIFANPLAGLLFDRRGRRPLYLLGMLLALLSTVGYALLRGFWPFLLTRLAWGLAWTLVHIGGLTMVLDVSDQTNRGRWMGVYNTWVLAGLAIGPVVGGPLVDALGFRAGMLACAAFTAAGLLVAVVTLPETARTTNANGQRGRLPAPGRRWRPDAGWVRRIRLVLRSRPGLALAAALYLIVQFTGEGVVLSTVTLLLQQRFGEQLTVGALVLGIGSAGGFLLGLRSLLAGIAGPLAGHLSDARLGRWAVIAGGLAAGMAGFGLLAYVQSLPLLVLGIALGAVSAGTVLAALAALVGDLTPEGREGAVMGLYSAAGDVGSTSGPLLAFSLVSTIELRWIYFVCAIALLAGLLLSLPLRRRSARGSAVEASPASGG